MNVVHKFSELPDAETLPLESWGLPKNWGLCVVGNALEDQGVKSGTLCIKIFEEENGGYVIENYYPVPRSVSMFFRSEKEAGKKEVRDDLKRVLGL